MLHRSFVRLVLVCVALVTAVPLAAAITVFGPKNYVRSDKPQTFEEDFPTASGEICGGEPMFVLVIENQGVSSAVVTLNGVTLLSERDFPGPAFRQMAVSLAQANHLTVLIKGGARDGSLRLSVERRVHELVGGPTSVTVDVGPATSRSTFAADDGATYSLLLRNAGVSNASVSLNGTTVVNAGELNPSTQSLLTKLSPTTGINELAITAAGPKGSSVEWMLFRESEDTGCSAPPEIVIDSPADGASVTSRKVAVTGTATGPRDIGIIVNGVPAQFGLDAAGTEADPYRWFATFDAGEGELTIIATASTAAGLSASDSRTIDFERVAEAVTLSAVPDSGATPLTAHFDVSTNLAEPVAKYELDLDGDGTYEISSATRPETSSHTYVTGGVRDARLRVTTAGGTVHTSSAPVAVQPFSAIDQVIRAAWSRFTGAMSAGDAAAAIAQLAGAEARAKYTPPLQALGAARLPAFAASIQTIHPVWIHGNAAHYLLVRNEEGQPFGYHVYFVRGSDGVWRVIQF